MKIMSIVGARPNFMKVAPIVVAVDNYNRCLSPELGAVPSASPSPPIRHLLVHTGQHYDEVMSGSFFKDLTLPRPDFHLGVGSGSHAVQTAGIMKQFEGILLREKPDVVIVVGDVNSTLACSLVVAKISYDRSGRRPIIAHVEAGLRSFDRSMPEEINRVITDHVSDLLFVTEESGLLNLHREGIPDGRIRFVGNTMIDSLVAYSDKAESSTILEELGLLAAFPPDGSKPSAVPYGVLTLHRPSSVDDEETFLNILGALKELAEECAVIFPAHPRTQKRIKEFGLQQYFGDRRGGNTTAGSAVAGASGIHMIDALGYLDFLCLMKHAALMVTDSGGIQEETTFLGIPCVTVRTNTERPVTVTCGTNTVAGTKEGGVRAAIRHQLRRKANSHVPEKWDGMAGERILRAIILEFQARQSGVSLAAR